MPALYKHRVQLAKFEINAGGHLIEKIWLLRFSFFLLVVFKPTDEFFQQKEKK